MWRGRSDEKAGRHRDQALGALAARRDYVITQLRTQRVSVTGGAVSSEIGAYAQELFYLEHALDSLARDEPEGS